MDEVVAQGPGTDRPEAGKPSRRWRLSGVGLPRSLDEVRFRDVAVAVVVALTIWGYADIGPHGRIVPGHPERHKTDFTVYTEAASAFFDGRDPYRVMNPRGWYYLYPPLFALAVVPLTVFDTETQVLAWYALNVVMAFGCFAEARRLWRLLRPVGPAPSHPLWIALSASLAVVLPTLDCFQRGQVGVMLLYFLMVGFRLVVQSRGVAGWLGGGMVLSLPAVLKLVPLLPVGFLLGQLWVAARTSGRHPERRFRASAVTLGVVLGASLFLIAIPSSVIGWRKNLESLRSWTVHVASNQTVGRRANFDIHSPRNQSLTNAVVMWADPNHSVLGRSVLPEAQIWARLAVLGVRGLVLVFLAALCLATGHRGSPLDLALGYGLACAATILISPIAWGHYYMIELPALVALPLWLIGRGRPLAARLLVAVPALLAWPHYLWQSHVSWTGLLGLGTTAWFLASCALIALAWDQSSPAVRLRIGRKKAHRRRKRREHEPRSVFS